MCTLHKRLVLPINPPHGPPPPGASPARCRSHPPASTSRHADSTRYVPSVLCCLGDSLPCDAIHPLPVVRSLVSSHLDALRGKQPPGDLQVALLHGVGQRRLLLNIVRGVEVEGA